MYTQAALLDVHERAHRSLKKLLEHCASLPAADLQREIEGFGYPTVAAQLQHVIGAEQYWVGVLQGEMLTDEDEADRASVEALGQFRERVFDKTAAYLRAASDEELSARRTLTTWGDKQVELMPAHVLLRTQTHYFQHQGEIASMARRLGQPMPPGLDFPLA